MAWDEDESMDVDVEKIEVNVDENEMDVHDVVQVEGRRRRLNIFVNDGGWWVTHTTIVVIIVGGGCLPWSCSCKNPIGFHWACWVCKRGRMDNLGMCVIGSLKFS
jgi:hypothetical protein